MQIRSSWPVNQVPDIRLLFALELAYGSPGPPTVSTIVESLAPRICECEAEKSHF